ncbi:acyl-CoA dehydrogenase [Aeropyrum pernix K1]|uniref:Acyl-CoA dehydrogenase n=2 Tax=Aeropyrum pernix TaxID=56636 RepID=Q9YF56_AERPE|nr:DNA alkylation response protein [Aeropyrum pernix]BAA79340.2 acyl-CoA dehydrogenase [Aeropyrum pernix K1]
MPLEPAFGEVSMAYGLNHYLVDKPLRDTLRYFTSKEPDLAGLGEYVGTELYEVAYRVDRLSWPVHVMWSVRGERSDTVLVDPALRRAVDRLMYEYGVNRHPYVGGSWHEHFAGINLVGDPGVGCILTITMQTAYALWKYGGEELKHYYRRLAGLDRPPMIGATWFTEIQGGSDLGANETVARKAGDGVWLLTGYKYFASGAGLADIALVTARPEGAPAGAKGLSLFAVPRYRRGGGLNYSVRRLKDKSGTIAVPTGEVELQDSEAYLIGDADKGIYYTLEDLMISRIANSAGAVGIARKAYLEAYNYAKHRRAFGKRIIEHPLVRRDLLEMEVLIEESLALTHKAVDLFEKSTGDRPPYSMTYHYARLMTHIAKNMTAQAAARVTMLAMELFGGIGFLREYAVERWHREALITPIWEGTSNIQALDMLEAMWKKGAHKPLLEDLRALAGDAYDKGLASKAVEAAEETVRRLASMSPSQAEFNAKYALEDLGHASSTVILENMAAVLGEERYHYVAEIVYNSLLQRRPVYNPGEEVLGEIIAVE